MVWLRVEGKKEISCYRPWPACGIYLSQKDNMLPHLLSLALFLFSKDHTMARTLFILLKSFYLAHLPVPPRSHGNRNANQPKISYNRSMLSDPVPFPIQSCLPLEKEVMKINKWWSHPHAHNTQTPLTPKIDMIWKEKRKEFRNPSLPFPCGRSCTRLRPHICSQSKTGTFCQPRGVEKRSDRRRKGGETKRREEEKDEVLLRSHLGQTLRSLFAIFCEFVLRTCSSWDLHMRFKLFFLFLELPPFFVSRKTALHGEYTVLADFRPAVVVHLRREA